MVFQGGLHMYVASNPMLRRIHPLQVTPILLVPARQPPSEQRLTAGSGSPQPCQSFSRPCQVPVLSLHLCFRMPSELLLQGKTSTEQVLEASYSLNLWEDGQERGLTMPVTSDRFGILLWWAVYFEAWKKLLSWLQGHLVEHDPELYEGHP